MSAAASLLFAMMGVWMIDLIDLVDLVSYGIGALVLLQ